MRRPRSLRIVLDIFAASMQACAYRLDWLNDCVVANSAGSRVLASQHMTMGEAGAGLEQPRQSGCCLSAPVPRPTKWTRQMRTSESMAVCMHLLHPWCNRYGGGVDRWSSAEQNIAHTKCIDHHHFLGVSASVYASKTRSFGIVVRCAPSHISSVKAR